MEYFNQVNIIINSLKTNIVDPAIEKVAPSHKLDSDSFSNLFPLPVGTNVNDKSIKKDVLRWQTFLKDFITWMLMMFILYLFWKYVLNPRKLAKQV